MTVLIKIEVDHLWLQVLLSFQERRLFLLFDQVQLKRDFYTLIDLNEALYLGNGSHDLVPLLRIAFLMAPA